MASPNDPQSQTRSCALPPDPRTAARPSVREGLAGEPPPPRCVCPGRPAAAAHKGTRTPGAPSKQGPVRAPPRSRTPPARTAGTGKGPCPGAGRGRSSPPRPPPDARLLPAGTALRPPSGGRWLSTAGAVPRSPLRPHGYLPFVLFPLARKRRSW